MATTNVYKAGEILKLYGHTWIKKFMILRNNTLEIFKTQPKKKAKKPEQTISLKTVYAMSTSIKNDGARSYFILIPHHSSSGYHLFATESVAELAPWVESLTLALNSVGKASEADHKKEAEVEVDEANTPAEAEEENEGDENDEQEEENDEEDKKSESESEESESEGSGKEEEEEEEEKEKEESDDKEETKKAKNSDNDDSDDDDDDDDDDE